MNTTSAHNYFQNLFCTIAIPAIIAILFSGLITQNAGADAKSNLNTTTQQLQDKNISPSTQPGYNITDLGTLGGSSSIAQGINDAGQIVGWSDTTDGSCHAFLWQDGIMTDLGTLGGTHSRAFDINDAGQIVGWSDTTDGSYHAFLWQDGIMTDLGTLGGSDSMAQGINDAGQIVGWSDVAYPYDHYSGHAFLWQDGIMIDLGTLVGGKYSRAYDINDAGQIVGLSGQTPYYGHAFLWQNGIMTDLGTLGGLWSNAKDINDAGQIVGQSRTTDGSTHAFLWQDEIMTDLGTLGGIYLYGYAYGINNTGQVVGKSNTGGISGRHAFLWQDGTMIGLGTEYGIYSGTAQGINDAGQIVGQSRTIDGNYHAFLMTPSNDLVITKVDSSDPVVAGEALTYTLTVTNNGPKTATGVIVTDTLPASVVYTSSSASQGSCSESAGSVTCDLGKILNGADVTVTIEVTPSSIGILTNIASVTATEPDSDSGNNSASEDTIVDFSCTGVSEIPIHECYALVALYNSTDGDNWTNNTNWLQTHTPSDWYRVYVEDNTNWIQEWAPSEWVYVDGGHVTNLILFENQLAGIIPAEIGNLSKLRNLWLQGNQLSGSIPSQIGDLAHLNQLVLSKNQLSGSIPSHIGKLTNLHVLDLRWNQLSGSIPPEIGNLANLTSLAFSYNQLSGSIPPEIGDLANLTNLTFGWNQLSGSIPSHIGKLTNLHTLDLSSNHQLSGGLPTSFSNLSDMTSLDFYATNLCEPSDPDLQDWLSSLPYGYDGTEIKWGIKIICNSLPGLEVVIQPVDTNNPGTNPVTITFSEITQTGSTTLSSSESGPPLPVDFKLGNPPIYFDIDTTASFTGTIDVCIDYSNVSYKGPANKLKLFHFENEAWVKLTASIDQKNKIICAPVSSLSPFVIIEPNQSGVNISLIVIIGLVVLIGGGVLFWWIKKNQGANKPQDEGEETN